MEEKAVMQRKLSRSSSKNKGKSLWTRKSVKKPSGEGQQGQHQQGATFPANPFSSSMDAVLSQKDSRDDSEDDDRDLSHQLPTFLSRSIIPDPLGELPAWFKKESDMAAANISSFRIKYPLHNPVGPRWYKNHHLIPPAQLNPGNRPPSFFSPSFPPMAASHSQDRSEDSTRLPGPSRTPSSTPLPTPNSSQVRIPELGGKPRSRKTSQDNVDMLDVTDPWGTHWHHQSPYDAGANVSPVSVDSPEGPPQSRSRLSSLNTTQTRRKTVTPSPLSQSTSALHLQAPETVHVSRKLSKRRKPVLGSLFGGHDKRTSEDINTSPASPYGPPSANPNRSSTIAGGLHPDSAATKRHSTVPPSASALSLHSSTKNERRGSVLGRLVRKFSILKKPTQDPTIAISERAEDDWDPVAVAASAADFREPRRSMVSERHSSSEKPGMEKKHSDPSKRVPPPRIDAELASQAETGQPPRLPELDREIQDHRSSLSLDTPFSPIGKLMIANPDESHSGVSTPVKPTVALPEVPVEPMPEARRHSRERLAGGEHAQVTRQHDATNRRSLVLPPSEPVATSSGKSSPVKSSTPVTASAPVPDIVRTQPPQRIATHVQPPTPTTSSYPSSTSVPTASASVPSGASTVPLLAEEKALPTYAFAPSGLVAALSPLTMDDSPLSKSSMLVNPPTPYDQSEPNTQLPPIERLPSDRSAANAPTRDPSPTKKVETEVRLTKSSSTTSRKTETFRLVRNPSDKVSSSGETITAEGEHWSVVNSAEAPRRRRTKEKPEKVEKASSRSSRDRDSRREQRKQEKAAQEAADNQRRAASQARQKSSNGDRADAGSSTSRPSRARSLDTSHRGVPQPMVFTLQDEPPRHRRSDDRQRDGYYQQSHNVNKAQAPRPGPSPISGVARVERLPSTSTRPTSELTSAADINALRAREAWEMDRLWKGRSMYHGQPESNVIASPSSTRDSKANGHPGRDNTSMRNADHGSSHTSYLVQPLQAHPIPASVFYANMPSAPPPIIYAATSPYGQSPHHSSHHDYAATYRSLPNSFTFPSKESPAEPAPRASNPLPPPPRESTYQPARLPSIPDRNSGSASEYWTKYTSAITH
ncbi:hypothetical protein BV22DRAFT_1124800 [Leucogyrophana mollusca]|uniref:Uncharacterized protein n=1 Tax=Leucogyrophana mollusca TaxID=85980 RepID=A0ACB8BX23_9AGAM|nr:hypothetical protein BV22DRAFT_1124800 [Leucogyrophana mollusca]